ncbi:hypothetical protein BJ508DRAFT_309323 [Ascobolus immersus RN42]|uniref:Uncharacterized protein n=1 Tax=Ascobolus immersus RN42 TaxID=1160509 RepID=A0A3N4HX03_ASCIM|nr:hypothetical protein BJ508DRAFT_309323 [Ascobolus immersus RN42]
MPSHGHSSDRVPSHTFQPQHRIYDIKPFTCSFCLKSQDRNQPLTTDFLDSNGTISKRFLCTFPNCKRVRCEDCTIWDGVGVDCGRSHQLIPADDGIATNARMAVRKLREIQANEKFQKKWIHMIDDHDKKSTGTGTDPKSDHKDEREREKAKREEEKKAASDRARKKEHEKRKEAEKKKDGEASGTKEQKDDAAKKALKEAEEQKAKLASARKERERKEKEVADRKRETPTTSTGRSLGT